MDGSGGQANQYLVDHNRPSFLEELELIVRINARFSESPDNLKTPNQRVLRPDEVLTLLSLAEKHGYTVENARDLKLPQDEISSELYAVWYAKENEISIIEDNIPHLIEFTGWEQSGSHASDASIDQDVKAAQVG